MIARECLNKLDDHRNTENWEWHDEVWCRSQGTRMLISVKHCYFFSVSRNRRKSRIPISKDEVN